MVKKKFVIIADYSQETVLTLDELCEICGVTSNFIQDLIDYEIIQPEGASVDEWSFDMVQLKRIQTAIRLQNDLGVNLTGVAVVLDLLDEIEQLRLRTELLERHLFKS